MAVLSVMCLYAAKQASAQQAEPAAPAVADIKPLEIGDTIPEYFWKMPLQVVNHPEGRDTITFNDYQGKLMILDFWATWCSSCIRAFPKLDSLQSLFKDDLVTLKVTSQSAQEIGLPVTSIIANTVIKKLFPHQVLPHYVWISPSGQLIALTAEAQLTPTNVLSALRGASLEAPTKRDLDMHKPPFLSTDFQLAGLTYAAVLHQGWYYGLPSRSQYRYSDSLVTGLTMANVDLLSMFEQIARPLFQQLGDHYSRNKLVIAVNDTAGIQTDYLLPLPQLNVYTYDINMSPAPKDEFIQVVWRDLNRLTRYRATIDRKRVDCYVLSAKEANLPSVTERNVQKIVVKKDEPGYIKNATIGRLVVSINNFDLLPLPLIDETGLTGTYNLDLPPIRDVAQLQRCFAQYGLSIEKTKREINVLTITDQK